MRWAHKQLKKSYCCAQNIKNFIRGNQGPAKAKNMQLINFFAEMEKVSLIYIFM